MRDQNACLLYSMLSTAVEPTAQSLCVGACVSDLKEEVYSLLKTILSNFIRAQFIVILFVAQIASSTLHFGKFGITITRYHFI